MNGFSKETLLPQPRTERALQAAAAAAGLTIGILSFHRGIYNDGIFFVQWLSDWKLMPGEKHIWLYPHILYLPLLHGLHYLLNLFRETRVDETLKIFSALFTAISGPFLVRFFLTFARPALASLATLLVLFAPSVWYCTGGTKYNTLHLAAAAFALAAAARPYKNRPALWFIFGALCLESTHLTGFFLWPAMYLLHERARRAGNALQKNTMFRLAAWCAGGTLLIAGIVYLLDLAFPQYSSIRDYFKDIRPGGQNYWYTAAVELILRSGVLVPAGLLGAAYALAKRNEIPAALAILITFPPYFHFIGASRVEYQGGYNLPATIVWALGILLCLRSFRQSIALAAAGVLLILQIYFGWIEVRQPIYHNLNRETAESIAAIVRNDDALILYIPPKAVDFDLKDLRNLTRLYLSRVVSNAGELDGANAEHVPYCDEREAGELIQQIEKEIANAIAGGRKAFVSFEVWEPPDGAPRMHQLSSQLREKYNSAARHEPQRLLELVKK
ncbi:MAG: hypothetical protein HY286_00875 [Planctomycetes bacterium]|nr:hypothetical protein [Planctomycetota bacterium]